MITEVSKISLEQQLKRWSKRYCEWYTNYFHIL